MKALVLKAVGSGFDFGPFQYKYRALSFNSSSLQKTTQGTRGFPFTSELSGR